MKLLEVQNVTKSYQTGPGKVRSVLNSLKLNVKEGEAIAIVGPSGSGKTTLLNQIGTMDRPDEGKILFRDQDISGLNDRELEEFRNQEIGFIFQAHHLLPQLSIMENVLLPTLPYAKKGDKSEILKRAESILRRVGLWDLRDQKPGELSGGECQRTAVVRALINNPSLLLSDEPTGALDEENAANLIDLLLDFNRNDKLTLIVVTHSMEIAGRMGKTYVLKNGQLDLS